MFVRRERLLGPLGESRVAAVEAGSGYGKSVLAWQLRDALGSATAYVQLDHADAEPVMLISSLRRALLAARLSDLAAAMGTDAAVGDPSLGMERLLDALASGEGELLFVLDDAHRLSESAAALVMRFARALPAGHRLLICARRLAGPLAELPMLDRALVLRGRDLAFTYDEAAELLDRVGDGQPAAEQLALLVEATQGWATALVLSARSGRGASPQAPPPAGRATRELIAAPLRRILDALSPPHRRAVVWLAHLPLISRELCEALAGEDRSLEALIDAGVPLARMDSGWWELPGPVAHELAERLPLPDWAARAAAEIYAGEGELMAALRVLLGAALTEPAAGLLEQAGARGLRELGFAALSETVEALPDAALSAHPGLLLELARAAEATHQASVRAAALDRARRLLDADADAVAVDREAGLRLELEVELARDQMWDGRTRPRARELAAAVLARAGPEQLVARARALDVLGRLGAWWSETGPLPEAEQMLWESARLARRLDEPTWAAQALVPLAVGCHVGNCRYGRAVAVLDEALADLPARSPYRVNVLSFRADALIELGRYREAEACLAQMRAIAALEREPWMFAFASWSEADVASRQGDRRRTVEAVLNVDQHRDAWFEQPSGVEFLAQAADYLDRAGELGLAREYLERAREREPGNERAVGIFRALVLARSGEAAAGRRATESVLERLAREQNERWPLALLRAFAAHRGGDSDAGELAAEAFELCLALGHPEGPLLRERAVADVLLPVAAGAGSGAAAELLERGGTIRVRLLGGFEVRRAGRLLDLPPGRPAKAVRAVAAAGGRLHAEELTELLWPDAPRDAGRIRLRNVLSRLRPAGGELLVREGESIALAPGHELDAGRFAAEASESLSARAAGDEQRAEVLARAALDRYQGELLPEDRYEEWAAGPREQLRARCLDLLDMLADAAERHGDVDEAARLIERALDAEPYDELRYLRLARLLASQGRTAKALSVLRRARATQEELGLGPSAELRELEDRLRAGPRR